MFLAISGLQTKSSEIIAQNIYIRKEIDNEFKFFLTVFPTQVNQSTLSSVSLYHHNIKWITMQSHYVIVCVSASSARAQVWLDSDCILTLSTKFNK